MFFCSVLIMAVNSFISNSKGFNTMKKEILKFLISSTIVLSLLLLLDLCVGFVGSKSLDYLPSFTGKVSTYMVKNNYRIMRLDDDIVILGPSRACHHYNTTLLLDSINKYSNTYYSGYNAGLDAQFINASCLVIESLLERYTPKMIVLDVIDYELKHEKNKKMDLGYMSNCSPFYGKVEVVKKYFDRMGSRERLLVRSGLYRFNDKVLRIARTILKSDTKPNDGFEPLFGKSVNKSNVDYFVSPVTDEYSENNLRRVIQLCKDKGVRLILVSSPRYRPKLNNELIRSLSIEYDILYIDIYNSDYFNNHPELFNDETHLNNDGATIYTQMFFEELKPFFKD